MRRWSGWSDAAVTEAPAFLAQAGGPAEQQAGCAVDTTATAGDWSRTGAKKPCTAGRPRPEMAGPGPAARAVAGPGAGGRRAGPGERRGRPGHRHPGRAAPHRRDRGQSLQAAGGRLRAAPRGRHLVRHHHHHQCQLHALLRGPAAGPALPRSPARPVHNSEVQIFRGYWMVRWFKDLRDRRPGRRHRRRRGPGPAPRLCRRGGRDDPQGACSRRGRTMWRCRTRSTRASTSACTGGWRRCVRRSRPSQGTRRWIEPAGAAHGCEKNAGASLQRSFMPSTCVRETFYSSASVDLPVLSHRQIHNSPRKGQAGDRLPVAAQVLRRF